MDFFRSILSDDPEPENPDDHEESETEPNQSPEIERTEDDDNNSNPNSSENDDGGGLWSLVKTLTTRSESVLETYRRDLKEFGSGLRKESDLFREVASRAVKELPSSSATAFDGVLKSTVDIITQGKDGFLTPSNSDDSIASATRSYSDRSGVHLRRYSRFDYQLNAIQNDTRTYCENPEDLDDYHKWKLGLVLGDKRDEIENLVGENGALEVIYPKIVPNEVDDATFWFRYFYKVHKLKQQEDLRAKLVKRSLSIDDDDEDLSWDIDDDDDEEEQQKKVTDEVIANTTKSQDMTESVNHKVGSNDETRTENYKDLVEGKVNNANTGGGDKRNVEEPKPSGGNVVDEKLESEPKSDEKVDKDGDVSSKSIKPSLKEEEDLDWDEIEDVGDNDEKKVSQGDIPNKAELRRRLSTAVEDEEDLSWDIDDDDDEEPVNANSKK